MGIYTFCQLISLVKRKIYSHNLSWQKQRDGRYFCNYIGWFQQQLQGVRTTQGVRVNIERTKKYPRGNQHNDFLFLLRHNYTAIYSATCKYGILISFVTFFFIFFSFYSYVFNLILLIKQIIIFFYSSYMPRIEKNVLRFKKYTV